MKKKKAHRVLRHTFFYARAVIRIWSDEIDFIRFHAIGRAPIFDDTANSGIMVNPPERKRKRTVFPILQPPIPATMYLDGNTGKILHRSRRITGK